MQEKHWLTRASKQESGVQTTRIQLIIFHPGRAGLDREAPIIIMFAHDYLPGRCSNPPEYSNSTHYIRASPAGSANDTAKQHPWAAGMDQGGGRYRAAEKERHRGLRDHVQQFLLELGAGFARIGRGVAVRVGDRDFFLDLLFYHVRLRCFVVIELKAIPFEPEFTGKLNFYLSAVDSKFRHPQDGPTIGLLLCKGKDRLVAEYALRDLNKPIGIAEWQTRLVESLPDDLKSGLPSVQDLEREFSNQ